MNSSKMNGITVVQLYSRTVCYLPPNISRYQEDEKYNNIYTFTDGFLRQNSSGRCTKRASALCYYCASSKSTVAAFVIQLPSRRYGSTK